MKEYVEFVENMKKYAKIMKDYPYYIDSGTWKYSMLSPDIDSGSLYSL